MMATPAQVLAAVRSTEAGTLEAIRNRKVLRLGATPSEPWYVRCAETGEWSGIGIALARQVAMDLQARVEVVETTWADAAAALQAGRFDVMFVLDPTPARTMSIDFPFAPVLYYTLGLMGRCRPPETWAELDRREATIAVPAGTSMERELSNRLPGATLLRSGTVDEAIRHFRSGQARFLALFHPALLAYQVLLGGGKVTVPWPPVMAVAGAGIRREPDKAWRDYLTMALTQSYENGTTERMFRDYLVVQGIDPAVIPGITKAALGG